jgi:hypothetical protein
MNKFDKPYRILPIYDEGRIKEIFNLVDKLDTQQILNYSILNNVPLSICENADGENLIHHVINLKMMEQSEQIKLNFIKFLVHKEVNPDKPNKYNQTPLLLACKYQLESIIDYLISIGVNINYQDNMGFSPLHYLFIGNIKETEENKEILDFVQYKEGINIEESKLLNEIKNKINKNVIENIDNDQKLFIKNLIDTITELFKKKYKYDKFEDNIKVYINKNTDINNYINNYYPYITSHILKQLNIHQTSYYVSDINIHDKTDTSWNPKTIDKQYNNALIKNDTNFFESKLKNLKNDLYKYIKTEEDNLISNNKDEYYYDETGLIKYYELLKNYIEDKNKTLRIHIRNNNMYKIHINHNNTIAYYVIDQKFLNNKYKHENSVDEHSDIINFENYTFIEGFIKVNNIDNNTDNWDLILKDIIKNINFEEYKNNIGMFVYYIILNNNNNNISIYYIIFIVAIQYWCYNTDINIINSITKTDILDFIKIFNNYDFQKWIYHLFKPYYISINLNNNNINDIIKWIKILLNNNYKYKDFSNIINNLKIDINNITQPNKTDFNKLINNVFSHINNSVNGDNDDDEELDNYLDKYFNETLSVKELCDYIIKKYESMKIKPLLLVLLDTISFLTIYNYNKINKNQFNINNELIKIYPLFNLNANNLNANNIKIIMSRCFGLQYIDKLEKLDLTNYKFNILDSNYMLYYNYENLINMSNRIHGTLPFNYINDNKSNQSIFTLINKIENQNQNNFLNPQIPVGQALFSLNKVTDYNNITISSKHAYVMTLIKNIEEYENKMHTILLELLIDDVNKNDISNIDDIIDINLFFNTNFELYKKNGIYNKLLYYYEIIKRYKKLLKEYLDKNKNDDFIKDYYNNIEIKNKINNNIDINKIIEFINEYNSYYYINSYIKTGDDIDGFSYYKLPLYNNPAPYVIHLNQQIGGNNSRIDKDDIEGIHNVLYNINLDIPNMYLYNIDLLEIYEQYKNNKYFIYMTEEEKYKINKNDEIFPSSILSDVNEIYKYILINFIKYYIDKLDKNIYDTVSDYLSKYNKYYSKNIDNNYNKLLIYQLISKLIQDNIMNIILSNIKNIFIKYVYENLTNKELLLDINITDIKLSDTYNISLLDNDIKDTEGIYNILKKIDYNKNYILYPNDFSNLNLMKNTSSILINVNNITKLILSGSNPYLLNIENKSPIYNLINNYDFTTIEQLKNIGIDFRYFEHDKPINYIMDECKNITFKMLPIDVNNTKQILNTITIFMYNKIINLILSNNNFRNNVLIYIEESFYLSTYLFIRYLSRTLLLINTNFNINDLYNIFDLLELNENTLNNFSNDDINYVSSNNTDNKPLNYILIEEKINENENNINKLNKNEYVELNVNNVQNVHIKKKLKTKQDETAKIVTELTNVNATLREYLKNIIIDNDNINIQSYINIFDKDINENHDLLAILMVIKQKKLLENINNPNSILCNKLNTLNKGFNMFSKLGESYFETAKYTDVNPVLKDINELLKELFKLTLSKSIELLIRKILLDYFSKTTNYNLELINTNIDIILNNTTILGDSMIDLLNSSLCDKLVKNSTQIFENNNDKVTYITKNTNDIFNDYFDNMKNTNMLSNSIINIFKMEVSSYLSTIVPQIIKYWLVNIENIMKFYINNYRCLETLKTLTN